MVQANTLSSEIKQLVPSSGHTAVDKAIEINKSL